MKNKFLFSIFFLTLLIIPGTFVLADDGGSNTAGKPVTFRGEVLTILKEQYAARDNGQKVKQQNLEVGILDGELKGQRVVYNGISDVDVVSANTYQVGDKVLVARSQDEEGHNIFYVTDFVRGNSLLWLLILFVVAVLLVGGKMGLRALMSLVVSFFLIMKVLVPLVFLGYDPLLVGIAVSFLVLMALIYLTEGWNRKAHLSVLAIAVSLIVTALLAYIFSDWSRLSGATQEEVTFLIEASKQAIDFHNLLLAAIIIGTLGVLDDVVVGQVEAVAQIREANSNLSKSQVFKMAMKVGRAHLGAIINTLFLAYAGASLPLILLFNLHQEPFISFSQVINNEEIATEIVRTLVGVIGLCLSAPIATIMAVRYGQGKENKG
ncbi:MAG: YibE/F family protein [Candidatus Falkowbacteria bacterium]|nr:YibE/F family protein [Candidatus Falkowbacteria bacterium]